MKSRHQGWNGRPLHRIIGATLAAVLVTGSISIGLTADAHAMGKKRKPRHEPPASELPAEPALPHGSFKLRLLSYNVKGLPFFWVDLSRFADIGRELARRREEGRAPHVVFLQEMFTTRTEEINAIAGYPYVVHGPRAKGMRMSAGLTILSEFPLTAPEALIYKDCAGSDCLSRKGTVLTRVQIPGVPAPLELYDTHMNASYGGGIWPDKKTAEKIRIRQVDQVREFMDVHRDRRAPALYGGDFNFQADGFDYAFLLSFTGMEDSGRACSETLPCTGAPEKYDAWREWIDHVFYIGGTGSDDGSIPPVDVRPIHYEHSFLDEVDGRLLSDHPGIEVTAELSW